MRSSPAPVVAAASTEAKTPSDAKVAPAVAAPAPVAPKPSLETKTSVRAPVPECAATVQAGNGTHAVPLDQLIAPHFVVKPAPTADTKGDVKRPPAAPLPSTVGVVHGKVFINNAPVEKSQVTDNEIRWTRPLAASSPQGKPLFEHGAVKLANHRLGGSGGVFVSDQEQHAEAPAKEAVLPITATLDASTATCMRSVVVCLLTFLIRDNQSFNRCR